MSKIEDVISPEIYQDFYKARDLVNSIEKMERYFHKSGDSELLRHAKKIYEGGVKIFQFCLDDGIVPDDILSFAASTIKVGDKIIDAANREELIYSSPSVAFSGPVFDFSWAEPKRVKLPRGRLEK